MSTNGTNPSLKPGRVYRTRDFASFGTNSPRLAKRLVQKGQLVKLANGLFAVPQQSKFGEVPPSDTDLMKRFLGDSHFVFTGPDRWNSLRLGSTALFAAPLVYNKKRSGEFVFGGRKFELRRVAFPNKPSKEWFVVDLFENADAAGVSRAELANSLAQALERREFDSERLRKMALQFGTKATQALVLASLPKAPA